MTFALSNPNIILIGQKPNIYLIVAYVVICTSNVTVMSTRHTGNMNVSMLITVHGQFLTVCMMIITWV